MKMAIYEVIEKVNEIDRVTHLIEDGVVPNMSSVLELLQEYRDKILSAKVDI